MTKLLNNGLFESYIDVGDAATIIKNGHQR